MSAFQEELLEAKYDAAGSSFFNKAEQGNEGAMNDLNDSAIKFIKNNEAALKAKNNMTDSFLADYEAVVAEYDTQRKGYNESSKTATGLTKDNTEANNNLYKKMMVMFTEARVIFRKEPALRDQFTFTNVLDQVVSASVAGIRGKVTDLVTEKGINKVKIVIEGRDKTYETDKFGKYDIAQLANGTYRVVFSCNGYNDVAFDDFEVKTGVYNTLNVVMEKVEVAELVAA
jgi:Carboxypeptidase regulatory-like domain